MTCLVTTLKDDRLICGFEDGTIQVRDMIHGALIKTLSCHKKKITAIKLCKADTILISGREKFRNTLYMCAIDVFSLGAFYNFCISQYHLVVVLLSVSLEGL